MRNRIISSWILLVLVWHVALAIPQSMSDGTPQLSVISTSTPSYPLIAILARINGVVLVDVAIDSDGEVVSAKAVEGHPLLRRSAELAAAGWKFQANSP